jgi:predicted small secreted protein
MKEWVFMFGFKIVLVCAVVATALLTGCSTVEGVGKDIQSSAQWTKEKMGGSK